MFELSQIEAALSKVKSGADFPAYIQELITLDVKSYETYVSDGHSKYFGVNNYQIESDKGYALLPIAEKSDAEKFKYYLKIHQEGQTDYPTFCKHAAECGVEKWKINIIEMTCTYYDIAGNQMLIENIPS